MYQEERLRELQQLLKAKEALSAKEMMDYFDVSRDTIRRDFSILASEGKALRTHGGIIAIAEENEVLSLSTRLKESELEKREIAQKAAALIQTGGTYFLDVSSITLMLAQLIEKETTIYTHSLDVANSLSSKSKVTYYLLGGKFFPKNRFFYSLAETEALADVHFDAVFLGAAGLKDGYVRFENEEDALVKRQIMHIAEKRVLLAERAKFRKVSTYAIGKITDFDYFVTDEMPDENQLAAFKNEVEIII